MNNVIDIQEPHSIKLPISIKSHDGELLLHIYTDKNGRFIGKVLDQYFDYYNSLEHILTALFSYLFQELEARDIEAKKLYRLRKILKEIV